MGGKDSDESDEDSVDNLRRTEGLDAQAFSAPLGANFANVVPPKYIRVHLPMRIANQVRSHNKIKKDFDHLFLAQDLYCPANVPSPKSKNVPPKTASAVPNLPQHKTGAIWAMKFSRDGKYLAAGGQDSIVRVWSVISTPEERKKHESTEEAAGTGEGTEYQQGRGLKLNSPVFTSEPMQEYIGHTQDVLDLSWSKNNFLLSSSMDKTVRLWHVTKKECLCCFQHSDFVTAIAFHPRDDRFFLSGSLDCKLRLWSIPDKQVAFWNELPELITAVAFTPDGKFSIAGSFVGLCLFYETDGLRYHTQIHVRSTRGKNSRGSKITGISAMSLPANSTHGEVKLLITSNDSRTRMYNFRDKSLEVKFKGNLNSCSQIHATFNDTGKFIICGSEDRKVYTWNGTTENNSKREKRGYEYFEGTLQTTTLTQRTPM
jgi:WD repeat-containing protein 44